MAYSDAFDIKGGGLKYEYKPVTRNGLYTTEQLRRPIAPSGSGMKSFGGGSGIDAILSGLDEESLGITDKLRSIYDSYSGGLDTFTDNMQPLIDGLENDLVGLSDWMTGYGDVLDEIKPNMVGATKLDPNATRYREEYVGNVASQADAADAATKREMASQGINPYANAGMTRENKLNRSAAIAGASNQAYQDWRGDYNDDLVQEQASNAKFAELYSKTGDNFRTAIDARTAIANINAGVLDKTLQAQQAKSKGYETLYDFNADRRTEALELGKQSAATKQQSYNNKLAAFNSTNKDWEYV